MGVARGGTAASVARARAFPGGSLRALGPSLAWRVGTPSLDPPQEACRPGGVVLCLSGARTPGAGMLITCLTYWTWVGSSSPGLPTAKIPPSFHPLVGPLMDGDTEECPRRWLIQRLG